MKNIILLLILLFAIDINVNAQSPGGNKFKKEFLTSINKLRRQGCNCGTDYMPPVPPLTWNDVLEKAAKGHAHDMASKHYFSHVGKDGRDAMTRAEDAGYGHYGYKSFVVAENIAQGQTSIDQVMDGWLHSEGHCKNLMNADVKEVGIWVYNAYWVQDFGGREEFPDNIKKMIKSGKAKIIQGSVREVHH